MKVLIDDGCRYNRGSGYGQLSRTIIQALAHAGHECLLMPEKPLISDDLGIDITQIPGVRLDGDRSNYDLVFRISPPSRNRHRGSSILYTQNALSDLKKEWQHSIQSYNRIIVPSAFDKEVFQRYHEDVGVCPQGVNSRLFRYVERYRPEREGHFQFLFVGSFSFRKGVDILFSVMSEVARLFEDRKIGLSLFCPTGLNNSVHSINALLSFVRNAPQNLKLNIVNKEMTPRWMARIYNQHDAVVTFSRGEGWCMPLHEALLSQKPVIAPDSTGMGESLPSGGVIRVPVQARTIDDLEDPFAGSFVADYAGSGIQFFEPVFDDAVAAVVEMIENYSHYQSEAVEGRRFILDNYSIERLSGIISELI
jgi:glycosyltransferase involved in cell wall biosynthesis